MIIVCDPVAKPELVVDAGAIAVLDGLRWIPFDQREPRHGALGRRKKTVGTNPWSWAAPAGSHAPMVLDIANTGVARGKIYLAKQKGLPIPEGWALTAAGAPTTDPVEAIDGIILLEDLDQVTRSLFNCTRKATRSWIC